MHSAIEDADPGLQFSGAVFAQAMTNPSQLVKMQDWPRMAANGWLPLVVPDGLRDFDLVDRQRPDERDQSGERGPGRPGARDPDQHEPSHHHAATEHGGGQGLHDFIFFEGTVISGSASRQSELSGPTSRQRALPERGFQSRPRDRRGGLGRVLRRVPGGPRCGEQPTPVPGRQRRRRDRRGGRGPVSRSVQGVPVRRRRLRRREGTPTRSNSASALPRAGATVIISSI
jgi:hypothetical protein